MNTFNYLSCSVSYQNEKDTIVKISKFLHITGIINRTLKPPQVQRHNRVKKRNTFVLPTLLHG